MTLSSAAPDLALIEAAARDAGAIARAAFGKPMQVRSKGSAGPVTEYDVAVDQFLAQRLRAARPDYGWLSEETPDNPERLQHQRTFLIDPIDGTQAFIDGVKQFTISIGVCENERACAGAIYNPMTDEMFVGGIGVPATLNGKPISTSARDTLDGATMLGEKRRFAADRWKQPWPDDMDVVSRKSIAYRLGLVAAGHFDCVILFGFKNEWDIAAGAAIVEAAGGRFTDPWGKPVAFNQPDPRAPGCVAAGPNLHALLIERTHELADPRTAK